MVTLKEVSEESIREDFYHPKKANFNKNQPYVVHHSSKGYYFLNRSYKFLGMITNEYLQYPDIGEYQEVHLYNDDYAFFWFVTDDPYAEIPNNENFELYKNKVLRFMERKERQNIPRLA